MNEWCIAFNGGIARSAVEQRDHEVCGLCGLDCRAQRAELRTLWESAQRSAASGGSLDGYRLHAARMDDHGLCRYRVQHASLCTCSRESGRFWQADHIVPVSLGGALLGLANLRTLCRRCHVGETSRLARERTAFRATLHPGGENRPSGRPSHENAPGTIATRTRST